jgi:hypothetical protein
MFDVLRISMLYVATSLLKTREYAIYTIRADACMLGASHFFHVSFVDSRTWIDLDTFIRNFIRSRLIVHG